jgi:hypothetical protein
MGVWIRTLSSTPYFSSPASGNPLGAALRAHTACFAYPDTDKWVQAPLISRHWKTKRWCGDAETKSPRIPYARCPIGLGIVVMITLGPAISVVQ